MPNADRKTIWPYVGSLSMRDRPSILLCSLQASHQQQHFSFLDMQLLNHMISSLDLRSRTFPGDLKCLNLDNGRPQTRPQTTGVVPVGLFLVRTIRITRSCCTTSMPVNDIARFCLLRADRGHSDRAPGGTAALASRLNRPNESQCYGY